MIDSVVAALAGSRPVLLPTDTVYGLCVNPYTEEAAERLYRIKGRHQHQPTALVASDLAMLFECVPELRGRSGRIARELLPGPYTLVFPNPARRFRWLNGSTPTAIGVRVPELEGDAAAVLGRVGAIAATSANLPGGPAPARLEDVPHEIRTQVAAELDGGTLPGLASTVIDCTDREPRVLRDGAAPAEHALRTIEAIA
jgi:tRNA threonylcarbamoyl adenosine modification protein (Sua5/YciO/YrdC/YwlC family)